jgi:uncharacterized RDD family membrane protein YckC
VSPRPKDEPSLLGHYAGAVTRLAAYVIDSIIVVALFAGGVWLFTSVLHLVASVTISVNRSSWWWLVPLSVWYFLYYWYCYTASGKTPGKALLGLRVVRSDGSTLHGARAAVRVVTFPLGYFLFGLGFIGIVLGRRRQAIYDLIADTAVVYDFDARAAKLRFLARQREGQVVD